MSSSTPDIEGYLSRHDSDLEFTYSEDVMGDSSGVANGFLTAESPPLAPTEERLEDFENELDVSYEDPIEEISAGALTPNQQNKNDNNNSQQSIFSDISLEDLLDDAIQKSVEKMHSRRSRSNNGSPSFRGFPKPFSRRPTVESDGIIVTVPMRRVSSTPTQLQTGQRRRVSSSPLGRSPSAGRASGRAGGGGRVSPLNAAYALTRRQMSLPSSSTQQQLQQRQQLQQQQLQQPLLEISRTLSLESSVSSSSSLAEEDFRRLARELATPRKRNRSGIFRSVRVSGSSLRSSTPPRQPEKLMDAEATNIARSDTGGTDKSEEEELGGLKIEDPAEETQQMPSPQVLPMDIEAAEQPSETREQPSLEHDWAHRAFYLATFAIFGAVIRVYLGRFFGLDCEFPEDAVHDFPLRLCVTASGRSSQRGGAVFSDLPANMIGSFIMGLLTSLKPDVWPAFPWLHRDHPLQRNDALHFGIQTGMCGSLTTFASWNTQLIVMMDGTNTALGAQVAPALFGYCLGIVCSVASFIFGTHVSAWLNGWRNEGDDTNDDPDLQVVSLTEDGSKARPPRIVVYPSIGSCRRLRVCAGYLTTGRKLPCVLAVSLVGAFVAADWFLQRPFYRAMWMSSLLAPFGALLRWTLSSWNGTLSQRFPWMPWGTLAANLIGSVISALFLALQMRYLDKSDVWTVALISGIRVGFAGSLSTVSTFVKELVHLANHFPLQAKAYYYGSASVMFAMLLSLLAYSPIVRSA